MKRINWGLIGIRVLPVVTIIGILILWQLWVVVDNTPRYLLPSPINVGESMSENWKSLIRHGRVTLVETLAGFGMSVAIGVPLAVAIVYSKIFENMLYPLLVGSQAIPKIAIAPLLLVWLGFGIAPKVVVAFLIAFFPVVVTTASGLRGVTDDTLQLVRSMGATTWQVFRRVRFPTAVPSMLAGFKVAVALSVVGAVVGEFVGANEGLGYYVLVASGNFDTSLLFASVMVLTLMGVVLFYSIAVVETRLNRWVAGGESNIRAEMFTA